MPPWGTWEVPTGWLPLPWLTNVPGGPEVNRTVRSLPTFIVLGASRHPAIVAFIFLTGFGLSVLIIGVLFPTETLTADVAPTLSF